MKREREISLQLQARAVAILTGLVEQTENLAIGCVGDLRLACQIVGLDTIAGGNAILAEQQTESRMFGQIVHLLRFALDKHLAQLVALNYRRCFSLQWRWNCGVHLLDVVVVAIAVCSTATVFNYASI